MSKVPNLPSIAERLDYYIKILWKKKRKDFADQMGITRQSVDNWMNKEKPSKPSIDLAVHLLLEHPEQAVWILTGKETIEGVDLNIKSEETKDQIIEKLLKQINFLEEKIK